MASTKYPYPYSAATATVMAEGQEFGMQTYLLDNLSTQGIFITDRNFNVLRWNHWLAERSSYSHEKIKGQNLFELFPALLERGFKRYYQSALQGEVSVLSQRFHRYILPLATANPAFEYLPQSGRIAPYYVDDAIVGTITFIEDVNDRIVFEQELRHRIADLERLSEEHRQLIDKLSRINTELVNSNAELDAFTYTASHDLKEPLRGINNYAHFLLQDESERLSDTGKQQLETIQRLTQRMNNLIESLAEYSRVGRMELELQVVKLAEVLEQVSESLQPRLAASNTSLRLPAELPTIKGNRVCLIEVFENLISNAIKYNDKPERWVEIGHQPGDPPVFYVRDNGIGIKPEHQDKVFHIFRRLHGRDAYGGGTGAGLTITKKIIERHGGKIWVESVQGEGSTFYFTCGPVV